jgi:two-component system sensor kinase
VLATLASAAAERELLRLDPTEKVIEVQEAERGRIARDLHDELGHLFAGVLDSAGALAKTATKDSVARLALIQNYATRGIQAVLTIAWTLRPTA